MGDCTVLTLEPGLYPDSDQAAIVLRGHPEVTANFLRVLEVHLSGRNINMALTKSDMQTLGLALLVEAAKIGE